MHKEIEVYVDDMIVKSQTEEDYLEDFLKLFQRLRKYHLRLNPNKCTIRVQFGKLLGFVVSQKGIELIPIKLGQFKRCRHQELKSKSEASSGI